MSWLGSSAALAILSFDVDAESAILAEGREYAGHPSAMSHQRYGPLVGVPRHARAARGPRRARDVLRPRLDGGALPARPSSASSRPASEVGHHGHAHRSPAAHGRGGGAARPRGRPGGARALRHPAAGLPDAELGAERADVRPARGVRLRLRLVAHGRRQAVRARDGERARSSSCPRTGASTTGTSTCTSPIRARGRARCTRRRGRFGSGRRSSTACAVTAVCSVLTMHPFLSGRPGRVEALRGLVEYALGCGDVEFVSCGEAARARPRRRELAAPAVARRRARLDLSRVGSAA